MVNAYIVLTGPTAAGKTAWLAAHARGRHEIALSADSRQAYRNMDIGTGKPTPVEQEIIPHYGVDILEPGISYSVYQFLTIAALAFKHAEAEASLVWVCGGAGLYIRALVDGLALGVKPRPLLRAALQHIIDEHGPVHVANALTVVVRDPQNQRRVMRAVENAACRPERSAAIYSFAGLSQKDAEAEEALLQSGKNLLFSTDGSKVALAKSSAPSQLAARETSAVLKRWYCAGIAVLDPGREQLARLIERRVRGMFSSGLVEEVIQLRQLGYGSAEQVVNGIAYREAGQLLDGNLSLEEAIERAITRTRQYAKRQRTYFRGHGWPVMPAEELELWAARTRAGRS